MLILVVISINECVILYISMMAVYSYSYYVLHQKRKKAERLIRLLFGVKATKLLTYTMNLLSNVLY